MKRILLASAAAILTMSAANAADAIVAPEPEAVEYVRVCDTYGAGYFYIPGTETCLRIHGYVRYDVYGGDSAYSSRKFDGWYKEGRFTLRASTATATELGDLKSYTELRYNYYSPKVRVDDGYGYAGDDVEMRQAYITLGGFKVGIDESEFHTFTGYLGDVINDDVVAAGAYRTGKISYTFTGGNGFSAVLALEEGGDDYVIDDYTPHIVGGAKYAGGWGSIAAVVAYDSVIEDWSAKVRGDVKVTDQFSLWIQGGYAGDETNDQNYGQWGGHWAVWGGGAYKINEKATFNIQGAYEDWGKTAVTANVAYELVKGFTITPEVSYTRWEDDHPLREAGVVGKDGVQGMVRFQRSF
jgi:opacity protein-like surface antigen